MVSKIIENIVININDKLVLNDRLDEEKTLGIIKKIEKDFIKKDIKISYREIEFKVKDFQMKANVIIENKYKLDNKY